MFLDHFDFGHKLLWTIDDLMTPEDCRSSIDAASAGQWLTSTVNGADGRYVNPRARDSSTGVLPDPSLAERLWPRLRPHLPERLSKRTLASLRQPLRCYRYEPGQHFGPHHDQSYTGQPGEISLLTFMVYLNDDFAGGETEFPEQNERIVPKIGRALLFQHMLLHEGCRVERGTKYVLRSDILYREE